MTQIDTYFCIAIGLVLYRISMLAHKAWTVDNVKNLYVTEIACPKCGARPDVHCFFSDGGYACSERWEAVRVENIVRKGKREANRKS